MNLTLALNATLTDVKASYPWMNAANAAAHTRATVNPDTLDGDEGDETRDAYHAVLTASEADLAMAVSGLVGAKLDENDVFAALDGTATIDGMPALEWLDAVYGADDE